MKRRAFVRTNKLKSDTALLDGRIALLALLKAKADLAMLTGERKKNCGRASVNATIRSRNRMTHMPQSELRNLLTTQKYRLATALNNFYNADSKNPAAGDAAAIDIALAIRVLVHSDEALLRQLMGDFQDRLIAFDPKLVKQVPEVELTPGNFAQTRGVPQ
jgi:hypothetical protein